MTVDACRNDRVAVHCRRGWLATMLVALASNAQPVLSAEALEDFDGSRGVWVRSEAVETFVAVEPKFRVLAVRRPGEASLMADASHSDHGLRLAFMGPDQIPTSFDVGNVPAEIIERSPQKVRVRLAPADGLRYSVAVTTDADRPRVTLDYELTNEASAARRVGIWSVTSYPNNGVLVMATGEKPRSRRRLVLSWWTKWPQPGIEFGRHAIAADVSVPAAGGVYKVGLINDTGWVAYTRNDQAIVSHSTFDPAATYPEDGANITIFQTDDRTGPRCEAEQMGPLVDVAAGASTQHTETLELLNIPPNPTTLPTMNDILNTADVRRHSIEAAMGR